MSAPIAVGDRVRVRQLPPGTWASSLAGQEGTVERVEGRDMLVRIDGWPEGGEQSWLTVDEVDRRPTIAELEEIVRRLRDGMNAWASDEDGVHPDAWEAYADACEALGERRPCPECGRYPCPAHCPLTAAATEGGSDVG